MRVESPLTATIHLAFDYLRTPSRAAQACARRDSLAANLWIYAAFTILSLIFFQLKPADFPDVHAPITPGARDALFYLGMAVWQPVLEAAWIVFILALIRYFDGNSWGFRLTTAVLWTAVPFILMVLRGQKFLPLGAYLACLAIWSLPLLCRLRAASASQWTSVAGFMLGINAVGLAILPPMALAVALKAPGLFTFTQAAGGLWILGVGMIGLRELTGLRLPRAFMAVLLSMFLQIAFAFTLHLLGLIPKEMLKALFYA